MRRRGPGLVVLALAVLTAGCTSHHDAALSGPVTTATSLPAGSTTSPSPVPPTTAPECLPASGQPPARNELSVAALTGVQVVSDHEVWAVGSHAILHTADAGRTWARQYAGPAEVTGLDFVDGQHGWAVTTTGVLATSDGGKCWAALPPLRSHVYSVHFVDATTGWGVASNVADPARVAATVPAAGAFLVVTSDGGRSWTQQTAPADVQTVCFSDRSKGWITAGGTLQRTGDGGKTWQPVDLSGRGGWFQATVQCAPGGAWVLATGGGATGHIDHALFQVTANGSGRAVLAEPFTHPADAPPTPGTAPGAMSVLSASSAVLVDYTAAIAPGENTKLAVIQPDGTVVRPDAALPEMNQPLGASFASAQVGWVVGIKPAPATEGSGPGPGLVEATSDGGRTWTIQYRTG